MRVIKQFMWGFQSHFRNDLEFFAKATFESIGFGAGIRAYLIGFAMQAGLQYPICFESERDPLAGVDFGHICELAQQLFEENPESKVRNSYQPLHERQQETLRDCARVDAVRQTLEQSPEGAERYFFVGKSGIVDGLYAVHPILSVPRARWDSKPALATTSVGRTHVPPSFQHALMSEILTKATVILGQRRPPGMPFLAEDADKQDLARRAAQKMTQGVIARANGTFSTDLYDALDAVASQPYEGRAGYGRIILAADDHPEISMAMQFLEPMPLTNTRLIRKALEMTGRELYLICDGRRLIGLGSLQPSSTQQAKGERGHKDLEGGVTPDESLFEFDVLGRGVWGMSINHTPLLHVANTQPSLPRPLLQEDEFKDIAERLFHEASTEDLAALWLLANDARKAEHGTILVVHRDAAGEAERLLPQAQRVTPTHLESHTVEAVTAIDGAVFVDPSARCHAVGVILDGKATGSGDSSRGARYNSAIRYQATVGSNCLVVIISEDGMIDLIPRLRRRIKRSEPEQAIDALDAAVRQKKPDYEAFFRAWEHLEALAFYLTPDQCSRANAARETLEQDRAKPDESSEGLGKITHIGWTQLEPDPDMNPSYYLNDPVSGLSQPEIKGNATGH